MFNQGLGKPQMTVEDRICDMMMQLDEHSDKIPEGVYLQFCDHLKVFHQNVQMNRKHRQKLAREEAEVLAREEAAVVDPVLDIFRDRTASGAEEVWLLSRAWSQSAELPSGSGAAPASHAWGGLKIGLVMHVWKSLRITSPSLSS